MLSCSPAPAGTASDELADRRRQENRRVSALVSREHRRRIRNMRRWASAEEIAQVQRQFERERSARRLRGGSNRVVAAYGTPAGFPRRDVLVSAVVDEALAELAESLPAVAGF